MRQLLKQALLVFMTVALPAMLWAQVAVTGTVTDASGKAIPGASIRLKNSNLGTSTDANGKFSLTIPGTGGTLEISAISFKSQTLQVSSANASLSIQLTDDVGKLDEVVVTGLATSVKRRNLANAVATISSKELNGTAPAQTFDAALNGKITGAYINANSGAPGGGISVKLRGVSSIFGNTQPLYVVDGVFIDNTATSSGLTFVTGAVRNAATSNQDNPSSRIADLRAEDIENIEILKGASAAAIYGSKAAAGVILVTTKRGKSGRTKITFAQDIGFVKARKLLGSRPLSSKVVTDQGWDIAEYNAAVAAGKIYDYEKEVFGETGLTRNSTLSLTGGTDKTSFYFSASQKNEDGIVKNTGYRSNSLRLNVDHRVNDNIKVGVSANYINSSSDRGVTNNDNNSISYGVALSSTPNFTELHPDANGNFPRNKYSGSNPLETIALATNNEGVDRFITGINVDAIFQRSANSTTRFIGRGGIDFYNLKTTAIFPNTLQGQEINEGTSAQGFAKSLSSNFILSIVNNFTPSSHLSLTTSAGITQENGNIDNILNIATRLVGGQTNVNMGGALTAIQLRNKNQDNGIFIQEEATIIDAVMLTAGIRFDRSTNNGDANKYFAYPKAGLSWNLTRMGFWNSNLFDNLKIRAAYGQAGNFPVFGSKFNSMVVANTGGFVGTLPSTIRGNPQIEPERTAELEAGIDFSMLNSRLNVEFSFYNKTITGFLLQGPVAGSTGFSTQWINAGDLRNRGVEISVNALPVATKNIRWTSTVNFWMNRSKITKLDVDPVELGAFSTGLGIFRIEKGATATQIIGKDGPGIVRKLGDVEPKFQMNFFNEVTFLNNFSLRFLLHWKCKGDNLNLSEFLTDLGGTSPDFDKDDDGNGVVNGIQRVNEYLSPSAKNFIQQAGYLRLREIGLFYTFSKLPTSAIKGLRIGISANNYWTKTKYRSYDPEVSNFGTGFSTNVEVMPFPASKRATFHLAVDF
jgi:TonB-linked SusC/RagA family outer membrane protein